MGNRRGKLPINMSRLGHMKVSQSLVAAVQVTPVLQTTAKLGILNYICGFLKHKS